MNLENIYKELETKSIIAKSYFELKNILFIAKDEFYKNGDKDSAQKMQWEIDLFSINFNKNKLSASFFGTDEKGLPYEYPNINYFKEAQYNYFIWRESNCKSSFLKILYSHFIWLSTKKNIKYAQSAIIEYFELINLRAQQDIDFPQNYYGSPLLSEIENLFYLSISVNYKTDEIKSKIIYLIKNYPYDSSFSYAIRLSLIELMLLNKKIFTKKDFKGLLSVCEKLIKIKEIENKESTITILEIAIKVQKKCQRSPIKFERKIGRLYELLSIEREDYTKLIACKFCEDAIEHYKKIKDLKKVKKLEDRYNELKKNIRLASFGEEIDVSEYFKYFKTITEEISSKDSDIIINNFIYDDTFFPKYEKLEKFFEENKGKFLFKELFTNSLIDVNGNTVQYFDDESEKKYFDILQSYNFHIQIISIPLITNIFNECIIKEKLNANIILNFLYKNTWFGKELEVSNSGFRQRPYSWLALIAPSINEFFINFSFYYSNPKNYQNYILCIDSLATKIEGIIRDICEFSGITPFEFKLDNKKRKIVHQKDIHKLLNEEVIINLISKDDLLLFKFVLIEKAGFNLRHKVAHSLMTYDEYNFGQIILLIMIILKLGKYNFVEKKKTN